jgi:hypothetical protein
LSRITVRTDDTVMHRLTPKPTSSGSTGPSRNSFDVAKSAILASRATTVKTIISFATRIRHNNSLRVGASKEVAGDPASVFLDRLKTSINPITLATPSTKRASINPRNDKNPTMDSRTSTLSTLRTQAHNIRVCFTDFSSDCRNLILFELRSGPLGLHCIGAPEESELWVHHSKNA